MKSLRPISHAYSITDNSSLDAINTGSSKNKYHHTFKWDRENSLVFKEQLGKMAGVLYDGVEKLSGSNVSQSDIDSFYSLLCDNVITTAEGVGICKFKNRCNNNIHNQDRITKERSQQPWFDSECNVARRDYFNLKNRYMRKMKFKDEASLVDLREEYVDAGKKYKKLLKRKKKFFHRNLNVSLRSLKSKNPKEFWNMLSDREVDKRPVINISMSDFVAHFSKLGSGDGTTTAVNESHVSHSEGNVNVLNDPISLTEVEKMIRKLKNSKACGRDLIHNEFLKNFPVDLLYVIVKFFNIILNTGAVPTEWCVGIIIPIFKKKGEETNPDNYRGITLLSCLGKLFTSILNDRITKFLDKEHLLGEEQAGFRQNYSTLDNIFVLKCIVDLYLNKKKRLYCAFIDYKKAFDLIDRASMWLKMRKIGVTGKILNVIQNIYKNANSCISVNGDMSELFSCNVGVRQGENLSPLLFSIFLNDFQEFIGNAYNGLKFLNKLAKDTFTREDDFIINPNSLLYADDTIILAESPEDLQKALNAVKDYCDRWHLTVNASKTKVVIFSRGKVRKKPSFYYANETLEIVDDFVYLGVTFNYNGSFKKSISKQVIKARRAMYSMLVKAKKLQLTVDTQCHLFDHLVLPVLLYGSEVWGCENINQIEVFYRKFLRVILNVNKCTPDCMVYGETGRGPILNIIKSRMIGFWTRIVSGKQTKYSYIMYQLMLKINDQIGNEFPSQWIYFVKATLENAGHGNIWIDQGRCLSRNQILRLMKARISDMNLQDWRMKTWENRICTNYRIFKDDLVNEKYFELLDHKDAVMLSRFRCRSHNLPVNKSRFDASVVDGIHCPLCTSEDIGDEYHYVFVCSFFHDLRYTYLPKNLLKGRVCTLNMKKLFNLSNACQLRKLSKFVNIVMSYFANLKKPKR